MLSALRAESEGEEDGVERRKKIRIKPRKRKHQNDILANESCHRRRFMYGDDLSSLNLPGVEGMVSRCDVIGFSCDIDSTLRTYKSLCKHRNWIRVYVYGDELGFGVVSKSNLSLPLYCFPKSIGLRVCLDCTISCFERFLDNEMWRIRVLGREIECDLEMVVDE